MTDLTELRRLAEAATPWPAFHAHADRTYGEEEQFFALCDDEAREVPIVHVLAGDAEEPDIVDARRGMAIAAYIAAADPQTVRGLLDTLDRYRAAIGKAIDALSDYVAGYGDPENRNALLDEAGMALSAALREAK